MHSMTDWSKVLEVFGSGIVGVYLVMILLQLLTQLSTRIIDMVEKGNKSGDAAPQPPGTDVKGKV
jgi:hypothetical protein